MTNQEIAQTLATHFLINGFEWRLEDGTTFVPTEDDLLKTLDKAQELLYAERTTTDPQDAVQLEVGRLVFIDRDGRQDVYVHAGELEK